MDGDAGGRHLRRRCGRSAGSGHAADDDDLLDVAALEGLQKRIVVAERDAAVGVAARPEHERVGEQALAAVDHLVAADRRQPDRGDAVEQTFAQLQVVDVRRGDAFHLDVGRARIVELGAEAGMRLELGSVRHVHDLGADVVDCGVAILVGGIEGAVANLTDVEIAKTCAVLNDVLGRATR